MNNFGKNLALWIIIGVLLVLLFNLFQSSSGRGPHAQLAFSDFLGEVERGQVTDVTIQGNTIQRHFNDGRAFFHLRAQRSQFGSIARPSAACASSAALIDDNMGGIFQIPGSPWFPAMLLFIGVCLVFFMRQMQSGGGKAMGSGKSRARLLTEKVGRVTFDGRRRRRGGEAGA